MSKIELQQNLIVDLGDIDYRAYKGRPAILYHRDGSGSPAEDPECEVSAVWAVLKDVKGVNVRVDILPLIDDTDELENKILTELSKDDREPNE